MANETTAVKEGVKVLGLLAFAIAMVSFAVFMFNVNNACGDTLYCKIEAAHEDGEINAAAARKQVWVNTCYKWRGIQSAVQGWKAVRVSMYYAEKMTNPEKSACAEADYDSITARYKTLVVNYGAEESTPLAIYSRTVGRYEGYDKDFLDYCCSSVEGDAP